MTLAVALGGGGSAGVGWEIGVLLGLEDEGVSLRTADTLIGTSAGSIVSVRLSTDTPMAGLFEEVCQPVDASAMTLDFAGLTRQWGLAAQGAGSAEQARQRIGDFALAAQTMSAPARRQQIAELLPVDEWPQRPIVVTAVSATTGRFHTFTAVSDVDLVSAVGASCAVPGVWPPVHIGAEFFIDGAVRSPVNLSAAHGHDALVVIAPLLPALPGGLERELAALGEGTACVVIAADAAANAAFGVNPLDVRVGPAAALEGRRQGRAAALEVRGLLDGHAQRP